MANAQGNTSKTTNVEKASGIKPEINQQNKVDVQKPAETATSPLATDMKVGNQVLYTIPRGPSKGEVRPAVVISINEDNTADLQVFFNPNKDGELYNSGQQFVGNVMFSEANERGYFTL